jgi:hypothetical protein
VNATACSQTGCSGLAPAPGALSLSGLRLPQPRPPGVYEQASPLFNNNRKIRNDHSLQWGIITVAEWGKITVAGHLISLLLNLTHTTRTLTPVRRSALLSNSHSGLLASAKSVVRRLRRNWCPFRFTSK